MFRHPMGAFLRAHADYVGDGSLNGVLYHFGAYPGIVPSADETFNVYGEVYSFEDESPILVELDDYEGCGDSAPLPKLFVREKMPVKLVDGAVILSWVYLYNLNPTRGVMIADGHFKG